MTCIKSCSAKCNPLFCGAKFSVNYENTNGAVKQTRSSAQTSDDVIKSNKKERESESVEGG